MKKTILFFIIAFLVILGFSGFYGFYEVRYMSGRASVSSQTFSIDNSYIFSTPIQAKANNEEKIRVTVFILNDQGLGVMGKKVIIAPDTSLRIETIQGLTDDYGKAYFDVSSNKAGEYYLEVKVDDNALKQKAHLVYN